MTRTHPHLQSLHATQNALNNLIKKINAMDSDAYVQRFHSNAPEDDTGYFNDEYSDIDSQHESAESLTPLNTSFSGSKKATQPNNNWDAIIQNLRKSKVQREEYEREHRKSRFHQHYRQFLDVKKLRPVKQVHQHERTKFSHMAQNLLDYVDKMSGELNAEYNAYSRKARMEDALLEMEGNLPSMNGGERDSFGGRESFEAKGMRRESFHSERSSSSEKGETPLTQHHMDEHVASSMGSPLADTTDSSENWDSFKELLKDKDRKRREKLRTRAAIIDLKQRRNRDKSYDSEKDKIKQDIQNRLMKLQEKQKKTMERAGSRSKSRSKSRGKSPRISRTAVQDKVQSQHRELMDSPRAQLLLVSPRKRSTRTTLSTPPPQTVQPEVIVARRSSSRKRQLSPRRTSAKKAPLTSNSSTDATLIEQIDALL